jgi:hypothetical protein
MSLEQAGKTARPDTGLAWTLLSDSRDAAPNNACGGKKFTIWKCCGGMVANVSGDYRDKFVTR